jgi:hypothetical protein
MVESANLKTKRHEFHDGDPSSAGLHALTRLCTHATFLAAGFRRDVRRGDCGPTSREEGCDQRLSTRLRLWLLTAIT